jgi:glycosyltransferase involved in cell wall biosynthesis
LQEKVIFYGKIDDPEKWYHKIDIFISNSYSEGLQVSPMEAMASGCYCLSHHWDGADELLPPKNLYYTEREFVNKVLDYHNATDDERQLMLTGLQNMVRECFNTNQIKVQIREIVEDVGAQYLPLGERSA